ncbi:MAG: hypothetical protein JXR76_24650 [Deltaproteobacteria bacterium]|nr:hypothetical protein [Deltaproteobacteria bacterium]
MQIRPKTIFPGDFGKLMPIWIIAVLLAGCTDDIPGANGTHAVDSSSDSGRDTALGSDSNIGVDSDSDHLALIEKTVALRGTLSVPDAFDRLSQQELVVQLPAYDPGSLLRCELNENDAYRSIVDTLGGVRWAYSVQMLDDASQPIYQKGLPDEESLREYDAISDAVGVEIEEADIVGLSEDAALFASNRHGLLLVDLTKETPQFVCAAKLPGHAEKFYYYNGQLVVIVEGIAPDVRNHSYLLHFKVSSDTLTFIEAVDLGLGSVLDSRRFNERLVIYTDMALELDSGDSAAGEHPIYSSNAHRRLRVLHWGATLTEEMSDTLMSDVEQIDWLEVTQDTHAIGDLVHQSSYYGNVIWASDRYFVVTESIRKNYLERFDNESYWRCTQSHTVEAPYTYCYTQYETRPNPNYVPPDNSSGDRGCSGTTLADCLKHVASVSNETIEVPVGRVCENKTRTEYICDVGEVVQYEVPRYREEIVTRLSIYEYTPTGFIRFASDVAEIQNDGLSKVALTDTVDTLTSSTEKSDLQIDGEVQTLYFQNGFLYVISKGVLQVYAMGENSLVRTATLNVANDTLQTSLFTDDTIYLSDFSWNGAADETSQLKFVDLSNPAFPTVSATTEELPGGHTHILAIDQGIFTIGRVFQFEGQPINALKLGLFGIANATELSYLILGTDLDGSWLSPDKEFYFDYDVSRLFLPYSGYDESRLVNVNRVGISHVSGQNIVSEGALETPEKLVRVRPEPGSDRLLGFGDNLIESIIPGADGFEMQSVLEYYSPIALYRYTDADDYVEVLQLGNQCRLHFAKAADLNDRSGSGMTGLFTCTGQVWAFEQNILFGNKMGVSFNAAGSIASLTAQQVATYFEARQNRPYCLLSTTARYNPDNLPIDFAASAYGANDFTCITPEQYNTLSYNFTNR